MTEKWKTVPSCENRIEISSTGKVKKDGKIYRPFLDSYGYEQVTLRINGERKQFAVHRLVAIHYVPNPFNLPVVHHIDGNKTNNHEDNLLWCTIGQNNSFAIAEKGGRNVTSRRIEQRNYNGKVINVFCSFRAAGEAVGAKEATLIAKCCRGIRKSAYGFIWTFGEGDREYKQA